MSDDIYKSPEAELEVNQAITGRPKLITFVCLFGFLGAFINVAVLFTDFMDNYGLWFIIYSVISAIVAFACFVGLWKMKKVAVYSYAGLMVVNQVMLFFIGLWTLTSLVGPLIVFSLMSIHINKMT